MERADEGQAGGPAEQGNVQRGDYTQAGTGQIEGGLAEGIQAILRTASGAVTLQFG